MTKFELNEVEEERFKKFKEKKKYKGKKVTFTLCFTETGIGVHILVKSSIGEEKDITDYASW